MLARVHPHSLFAMVAGLLALLLTACAGTGAPAATEPAPSPRQIPVCWGYGCTNTDSISLSDGEWWRVHEHFGTASRDAATERRQIAHAVAEMEQIVGPKTGTHVDVGGTFPGLFRAGQMDCIDESTNTTAYLRLFAAEGLLRWHAVGQDATRGYFLFGWPHTTATIREKATGEDYAVDAWFFDNGAEPVIVPLKQWRSGWSPPAPP